LVGVAHLRLEQPYAWQILTEAAEVAELIRAAAQRRNWTPYEAPRLAGQLWGPGDLAIGYAQPDVRDAAYAVRLGER